MPNIPRVLLASACLVSCLCVANATPVINEIMFHPLGSPGENRLQEWIEIYNPDIAAVDLSGWRLSKGVTFTIPPGTTIPAGGYLVVAADVATFNADHPGFAGLLIGGWVGHLSNTNEQIQLDDATGAKVNDVSYASEGDWALRARQAVSLGHQGWEWVCDADGNGATLELRNPTLGNGSGQNWGVSTIVGGTPGAVNSLASTNVVPLIKDPKHKPDLPHSTDPIVVSCGIEDEAAGATATLHWRLDGAGSFNSLAMTDTDGDGRVEATIPAQANLAIVEWYISATDGTHTRTWPAPARTSDPGVLPETFGQVTNALLQVDNNFDANATFQTAANNPIYRIIMTAAERNEFVQLQTTSGQEQSEATFNGTFISHDGTGTKVRYRAGIRNRGTGSALGPPNNYHVGFPNDNRWNDRASMAINCRFGYSQAFGQALVSSAGIATQDAAIIKVRLNGADLSEPGVPSGVVGRMYSRYVRLEGRGTDFDEHHFPADPDGNLYRLDDHAPGAINVPPGNLGSGEFRYEGTDPAAYSDTFIKETNKDANDYSDLINFCKIVSAPITGGTVAQPAISDANYVAAVSAVLDVDEFYRYIATDALIGNMEGGLGSGRADDATLYSGLVDSRFRFIFHDLDTIFDIGDNTGGVSRNIFSYDGGTSPGTGILGLTRLFNHPQLVPRYYAALLEGLNTWFNNATIDPIVDQIMAGWVPLTDSVSQNRCINDIKAYVNNRRANVLAAIQQNYSLNVTVGGPTTTEGYQRTNDGSATFSGTFNVAKTYSITVNGVPVTAMNYRTTATTTQGTWSLPVAAGGGSVLHQGLNHIVVQFWDAPNGMGNVLNTLTANVLYQPTTPVYTDVSGTISAGSLRLIAPATFIPGKPFLVRVDLLDAEGNLNRAVWDTTVALTSTAVGVTLPSVQLYNGMGSALVTAGGGGGQPPTIFFSYGTGGTGGTGVTGTPGSTWKTKTDFTSATLATFITDFGNTWRNEIFDDSAWVTRQTQTGYGDNDENNGFIRVDYDTVTAGTQSGPAYLFRNTFAVADVSALASVTGEVKFDDSCAVYVNGTQVFRHSDLTANAPLTEYTQTTTGTTRENATAALTVPLDLLHNGTNTIAVEVHQHDPASSDVSFDLKLQGNYPASDPGNFTLTANGAGFAAQKALTSLTNAPAITTVSGTLPVGTTTWTGVIQVTGDVTVPVGGTLDISAGTHVLVDGDATAGSTAGKRIIVNGTLNSNGTLANPVAITATSATDRWGGFVFSSAQPSTFNFTLLNHAGHTAGVGHTGRGPMLRLTSSAVSLIDSVLADGPAKGAYSSGTCSFTMTRSLIERMITGPEVEDGCTVSCTDSNIQHILPDYRESNAPLADDEDCFYVHNGSGASFVINRCVFARCGDDVIDCLGGPLNVQDSILREGWDKGISLLNNDLTITRTQIIRCDKGIALKDQNADTKTVTATNLTIVGENHDSTQAPWGYTGGVASGDPDTPATGFYTQNKAGQSNTGATLIFNAKNCIVQAQVPVLVDSPYDPANSIVTYSDLTLLDNTAFAWPGTGNIGANPLYTDAANGNYRITGASPCRDTGDPATFDPDLTRADMGALPYSNATGAGTVTWTLAGSPYHLIGDATVPAGTTLVIQPGVTLFADENKHILVNGSVNIVGDANHHITLGSVPNQTLKADPADAGLPLTTPKWGGLWIENSNDPNNIISYVDFVDAQDALSGGNSTSRGCIELKESACLIDHCTFRGTHLHMIYGDHCSFTIQYCTFPDVFAPTESPGALNNVAEPVKMINKFLPGGHAIVRWNVFHGNKGHNDVLDVDSDVVPNPILQVRENLFLGQTGDEDCDLGGDVLIDGNFFAHGMKDLPNTSNGYASAFTTGDAGTGTTIVATRNILWDVDHATALKSGTGAIFEHNTCFSFHTNTVDATGKTNLPAVITLLVPLEGSAPGDGAYCGENIFWTIQRIFGDADRGTGGVGTFPTRLQFDGNMVDPATTTVVGSLHPGGLYSLGTGNFTGDPKFVDAANGNFALSADSPARGASLFGKDLGALVPSGAWITGEPPAQTPSTSATLTIGGPGIFYYKWKLDNGSWSAPIAFDPANPLKFPRNGPTIRTVQLQLSGLANGPHTVSVVGQDFAGVWQDDNTPTVSKTWTVNTTLQLVQLNEIRANSATGQPDSIELYSSSASSVALTGWSLTDDPAIPGKYAFPAGTTIAAGGYIVVDGALSLDADGDTVYLYEGTTLRDSITFGQQIADKTIGRDPVSGAWTLCNPTFGAVNTPVFVSGFSAVKFSEWLASGEVLYDKDWIELQNTSANPALLTGLRITDNRVGNPSAYTFPPLSYIAANGYVRLIADGSTTPGHLSFSLDAEGENLTLLNPDGTVLDTVFFYPQTTDYSMGRDAGGALTFYELPTRGFLNGTSDPAYANALAILHGLRITELMYNAIGGSNFDYVELRNVGATALALGGVKFVNGIDFTFPAMTLNPGEYVIVAKDLASFRSRYGNGPVVAGTYLGQLDNGGEGIAIQLPPPFDANILTFSYKDGWYPTTDGFGPSLIIVNAAAKANTWGDRESWSASAENGGNPAGSTARTDTYSGFSVLNTVLAITQDDDGDGIGGLMEFSLGMDIYNPNFGDGAAGLPIIGRAPDGHATLSFLVPEVAGAVQGHGWSDVTYRVQAADSLGTWTNIATKTFTTSWTGNVVVGAASGGFVPVTITDTALPAVQRFLRLQAIWTP